MSILLQLNKTIYKGLKVRHVTSFILIFFSTHQLSWAQGSYELDNKTLIEKTIYGSKEYKKSKKLNINLSNDNSYLISIIETLKFAEIDSNKKKVDSLKSILGIDNSLFHKIFNIQEYDYLIGQKEKSTWNQKKLKIDKVFFTSKNSKESSFFVGKPIYTIKKDYSLVITNSCIIVFTKIKNSWEELTIIGANFK